MKSLGQFIASGQFSHKDDGDHKKNILSCFMVP